MSTSDDDGLLAADEHINPATGYVETDASYDGAEAHARSQAAPDTGDVEHVNPATGYIETEAHRE